MTGVTEAELMRAYGKGRDNERAIAASRPVSLNDLTEIDRRRLMHERIRQAEARATRLLEALTWIAEYGTREGDLRDGHETAIRSIALNTVLADRRTTGGAPA